VGELPLTAGDGATELGIERQAQAIPRERLVEGRMAAGQGQRRGIVEHLAHLEVLEVRTTDLHPLARSQHPSPLRWPRAAVAPDPAPAPVRHRRLRVAKLVLIVSIF